MRPACPRRSGFCRGIWRTRAWWRLSCVNLYLDGRVAQYLRLSNPEYGRSEPGHRTPQSSKVRRTHAWRELERLPGPASPYLASEGQHFIWDRLGCTASGLVDVALLSVLRDGLLRRSEASTLRWGDVEIQADGSARIHVRRSKTLPEAEGTVLYIGQDAAAALVDIMPAGFAVVDPSTPVFGLSASQIGRRVNAAAKPAGLGDGFTGHSGRVGMAQDLAATGVKLPALMNAGRWKSPKMPARYTERQAAGRGAVARYYHGRRG